MQYRTATTTAAAFAALTLAGCAAAPAPAPAPDPAAAAYTDHNTTAALKNRPAPTPAPTSDPTDPTIICARLNANPPNHLEWGGASNTVRLAGDRIPIDTVRSAVTTECPAKQTLLDILDAQVIAHDVWLNGWGD